MPTSSFDTFFACTIILAAALIATGYVTSTMQTRISNTQNINKQSYLQAIANHIVTSPGTPSRWGTSSSIPTEFGLAASKFTISYSIDIDKITRLNSLNSYSLSYMNLESAANLNNLAVGVAVHQIMNIDLGQPSSYVSGNLTYFRFLVLTSIDSEPVEASLNCYVVANNYLSNITGSTSNIGSNYITFQIPAAAKDNALALVFARATFDDRLTSYAVYNIADSIQENVSNSNLLTLSPLNYELSLVTNSSGLTVQNGYVFSYAYQQTLSYTLGATQCAIPNIIDKSPLVIMVYGFDNGNYFQQWVSYPQVPFKSGSYSLGSQQNVFSYIVTISGVLYNLEVSLGGATS